MLKLLFRYDGNFLKLVFNFVLKKKGKTGKEGRSECSSPARPKLLKR